MAIEKELVKYITNHFKSFDLKINNLQWPKKYGINFYDIVLKFIIDKETYTGRGSSSSGNLAIIKAFSEAVERYSCVFYNLPSTNGLAIHTSKEKSIINSINELKERDLFLCHYLTSTKMNPAKLDSLSPLSNDLINLIETNRSKVIFLQMRPSSDYENGICVIIDGRNDEKCLFGAIVGTCYGENYIDTLENALIECARDYISIIENGLQSLTLDQFVRKDSYTPQDHLMVARNYDYAESFIQNIVNTEQSSFNVAKKDYSHINTEELQLPKIFSSLPLFLHRSTSENMQDLFFGQTGPEKVNYDRLKEFSDKYFNDTNINLIPHPVG